MNKEKLSKCAKIAMTRKNVNTEEMAEKLGVAESTVANYRAGKVRDINKLSEFAKACDLTFNELMGLAD